MRSEDQVEAFVTWYTAHMVDHLAGAESRRQS
jgi:hypothetical protein